MTYRLTNLGASFAPNTGMPDVTLFEENATEPAHHFFLTMVAGLSALAVGWVIGCALTGNIASRLVSSVVFGSALLQTEAWRHQLFIVHPDVVLAPFAAGLAYFLLKGGHRRAKGSLRYPCERDARHGVGDQSQLHLFRAANHRCLCVTERPANDHATWLHRCAGLSRLYCNRVSTNAFSFMM